MQQVQNLVPGLLLVAGLLCLQYPTQCEAQPTGSRCPPVKGRSESCVCQVRKGFMVDLSSLGKTDGTPRFTNLNDGNNWLYSYNPCKPFTSSCGSDLHICQTKADDPNEHYPIASGGTEEMWLDTDNTPYLYYTGPGPDPTDPNSKREAVAYFHCDKDAKTPRAETVGDSQSFLRYVIDVHSDKACETIESSSPNGPGGPSGGVAPGEIGIVLIVLLIVGVAAYFIIGTLVMVFHYKESGTNVIPNKNLWTQFPLLVKDGFVFTFGPCITFIQGKVRGSQGYSKT